MSKGVIGVFETGDRLAVEPNQALFRTGDRVRSIYLLTKGQVDLVRHTSSGTPLILKQVGPGGVVAEASVYSDVYHCDGVARIRSGLLSLPVSKFRAMLRSSPELAASWAANLATALQKARMQSEIRSLKTVAERLDAWLLDNEELPPRGQLQDLAHVLGVSREALYRELAKRRDQTAQPTGP